MLNKPPTGSSLNRCLIIFLSGGTDHQCGADSAHPRVYLECPMTLFANGYVPVIEMVYQFSCFHCLNRTFRVRTSQHGMDQFQVSLPDAARHEAGRTDTGEA